MEGSHFSKWLIIIGIILIAIGLLLWIAFKLGIPFGKLPGDIAINKENYSIYFPVVSSIIISIFLTIIINIIAILFRK